MKTTRTFTGPVVAEDAPNIGVWKEHLIRLDGSSRIVLTCKEFGDIGDWHANGQAAHQPAAEQRYCVHRLTPMPSVIIFANDWVRRIHWRAAIMDLDWSPVIASRRADVLTLMYDVVGPVEDCDHLPHRHVGTGENRWHYKLYPMHWADLPDANTDHLLLGVLQDG